MGSDHRAVFADISVLTTLPDREYAAGLAEVVKYGIIYDADFFTWMEDNAQALVQRDKSALTHIITRSCEVKAAVVSEDEREGEEFNEILIPANLVPLGTTDEALLDAAFNAGKKPKEDEED